MLKINIISIGKNKDRWIDDSIAHYIKMLKKYATITFDYIPGKSISDKISKPEMIRLEGSLIRRRLKSDYHIALSEKGKPLNSIEFSRWLSSLLRNCNGSCDIMIGGIHGLDPELMKSCRDIISLSPMTMSHLIVRPVLLEQLYRGFSILSGGKYHK